MDLISNHIYDLMSHLASDYILDLLPDNISADSISFLIFHIRSNISFNVLLDPISDMILDPIFD